MNAELVCDPARWESTVPPADAFNICHAMDAVETLIRDSQACQNAAAVDKAQRLRNYLVAQPTWFIPPARARLFRTLILQVGRDLYAEMKRASVGDLPSEARFGASSTDLLGMGLLTLGLWLLDPWLSKHL